MATPEHVQDTMTAAPLAIDPDASVLEAARLMQAEDVGSLPVVVDERLIGVITDRDIVLRVVAQEKDPATLPVAAVASRDVVTVRPNDRLDVALHLMATQRIRRLLVVEDEHRLVGVLAQADVARHRSVEPDG